jgi:hypothetical protein
MRVDVGPSPAIRSVVLFSKMPSDSENTRSSRMLAVIVCSDLSARAEAAMAYASTVSGITGRRFGIKLKQRRDEGKPPARGYETTVVAVGREDAVGNVVVPGVAHETSNLQEGASQAQRQDACPVTWDAYEPAVLTQAASLQDVVHRVNQWCPSLAVVVIGHDTMDGTTVTHPNVMLYLCEDDSAECLIEASEAAAVGAAWSQSDADLSDVIGVMLAPPWTSRRFCVVSLSRDVMASVHVADARRISRKMLLSDVAAAASGTVYDYLRTGSDAHALRTTCRHLTTAFDAAIDNEPPTMNGIAVEETEEDSWRWCPLFRIPRHADRTRARKAYMTQEVVVDAPRDRTINCDVVVIRAARNTSWSRSLRHFWDVRSVEVHGVIECRSFSSDSACEALVHTILPLSPHHAVFLHGRRDQGPSPDRCSSVRHLDDLACRCFQRRHNTCCDGVLSIQLRLCDKTWYPSRYDECDSPGDLWPLRDADLSRLVELDVKMSTHQDEALVAELVSKAPNLEAFTLRGSWTDVVVYAVAAHCPGLRQVGLALHDISNDALTTLVSQRPGIEEVVAWSRERGEWNGTDFAVVQLKAMLTGWRRLRSLTVTEIEMSNSTFVELGKHCPHLEYIYNSNCHGRWGAPVNNVGVAALAQGCPRLRHLDLSPLRRPVELGDAGAIAVAEHCASLTHLNLSFTGVTDAGVVAVAKHCSLMEHLDLFRTSITNIAISAIATSLPLLRCLDLTETAVDSTGIVPLGEGCPRMEEFSASITDSSMIERVLQHWPRVKKFDLQHMVPTASLFAAFGRHNSKLECVALLRSGDSRDFTARLSDGALLITIFPGTWVQSTSYLYAASLRLALSPGHHPIRSWLDSRTDV